MAEGEGVSCTSGNGGSLKRRRVTRACDRCHRGGIKCSPSSNPSVCDPCAAFGSVCTFERPMKRRGPAPTRPRDNVISPDSKSGIKEELAPSPEDDWTYPNVASHEQISSLIDTYYAIAYPMYPIFHWPTLIRNIRSHAYLTSRPFCAAVMAMCALATARIEAGVSATCIRARFSLPDARRLGPTSGTLCRACEGLIPSDLSRATDVDYKRAKIILSGLSMQHGFPVHMHKHLGDYLTMCAVDGFHNEARWPAGLKEYEIQERRRLFWVGYQSDVYSAVTWGGMLHHRESQSTVLYPAEVFSDDDITADGFINPPVPRSATTRVSFLRGWNFVTDLYRMLEHTLSQLRTRRQIHDVGNPIDALLLNKGKAKETVGFEVDELMALVQKLHDDLPKEFRTVDGEMTGDENNDRYGFQAANMIVTLQTLKMVMAGMADWSVEQRCAIAGELVDAFATVPMTYVQALSCPLLLHLAGVGHLLASILSSPLSPTNYLHLRHVLLRMADLVSSIETHTVAAHGIAPRLREHVERIDRFMIAAGGEGGLQAFAAYLEEAVPTAPLTTTAATATTTANGMSNLLDPALSLDTSPPSNLNGLLDFGPLALPNSSSFASNAPPVPAAQHSHQISYQREMPLPLQLRSVSTLTPAQPQPQPPSQPHRPWTDQYTTSASTILPSSTSGSNTNANTNTNSGTNANTARYPQTPYSVHATTTHPPYTLPQLADQAPLPLPSQEEATALAIAASQAPVQLPDDMFADWSMFLFGETGLQGDAFDFLSTDWQNQGQAGLG